MHEFAGDLFTPTTALAKDLSLYGAGEDLLSEAYSGDLRGMGPGYAELDFEERPSEPVICFLTDKTEPGAWNLALYKMQKRIFFDCPGDLYDLLMYIGAPAR
ncbi:fructose 1,6-bisphosphatase [Streptomyces sp. NRRL S-1813]|uniref:fructose 1,6-bisphosphatase n=1 Tax=Streptomyces sp. NRRL S-1813 TaxID=1463888 RepID=UPI000AC89130|nr:fructose 1,6-bisphosphatase [Streptomyces sp. NRRL S-1813]